VCAGAANDIGSVRVPRAVLKPASATAPTTFSVFQNSISPLYSNTDVDGFIGFTMTSMVTKRHYTQDGDKSPQISPLFLATEICKT
jgi:hypothetical protein